MTGRQRELVRAVVHRLGLLELAQRLLARGELLQRFGRQRLESDRLGLLEPGLVDRRRPFDVAALEHPPCLEQSLPGLEHLLGILGILGHWLGAIERRQIGAGVRRRQPSRDRIGALSQLRVREQELVDQRSHRGPTLVQARHAAIEHRFGLLLPDPGRRARVVVCRDPLLGPAVEIRNHPLGRVLGERQSDLPELGLHLLASRCIPHRLELHRRARADLRARTQEPGEPERRAAQREHGRARHHELAGSFAAATDLGQHRVHARPALVRVGGERPRHDAMQPRRRVAGRLRRLQLAIGHGDHQRVHRVAVKRFLAIQGLEQRHREAELVGANVRSLPEKLLRRHVRRRPRERARSSHQRFIELCRLRALVLVDPFAVALRQPEVEHAHQPIVAEHGVVGLEVAVHQAGPVGCGEPCPGLLEHLEHRLPVPRRLEPLPHRLALDELHRDVQTLVVLAHVVDRDDVGVVETRHRLGLALHPSARLGRHRALGPHASHELDRDLPVELRIEGRVHDPHPAGADAIDHAMAADLRRQRPVDVVEGRGGRLRPRVDDRVVSVDRPGSTAHRRDILAES